MYVKQLGGALDLLGKKENALKRWMLAGPEQANILEDFDKLFENNVVNLRDFYHDEGQASQMHFKQYVELLARGWEDIVTRLKKNAHIFSIFMTEL